MLMIGEFSKLGKISVKALRWYDEKGILKPIFVDSTTQYRYYSEEQLALANRITAWRSAGLSIDDIRLLLSDESVAVHVLNERRRILVNTRNELNASIERIDKLLSNGLNGEYKACFEHIPQRMVFVCRGYVGEISNIRQFVVRAHAELKRTNPQIEIGLPDYCCVIYPEMAYRERDIFIEYAQSVASFGKDGPTIKFKTLPAIDAVCISHYGSYETLRNAYAFGLSWAENHGYALCGEARERYIHGQWDRADEAEWLTEIQLPVSALAEGT